MGSIDRPKGEAQSGDLWIRRDQLSLDTDIDEGLPDESKGCNPERDREKNQLDNPNLSLQRLGRREVSARRDLHRST